MSRAVATNTGMSSLTTPFFTPRINPRLLTVPVNPGILGVRLGVGMRGDGTGPVILKGVILCIMCDARVPTLPRACLMFAARHADRKLGGSNALRQGRHG